MIVPFEIPFDQHMLDDLRRRLAAVRWNDSVTADWSQATQSSFLAGLIRLLAGSLRLARTPCGPQPTSTSPRGD